MWGNLTEGMDKVSSRKDKDYSMSDTAYYSGIMREAYPVPRRYSTVKGALNEAVRFIAPKVSKDFSHRRARAIWEGRARRIDAEEAAALRLAEIEEGRREQRELRQRLARLDAALAVADEAFHCETRTAMQSQMGGLRGMDRTRDHGGE